MESGQTENSPIVNTLLELREQGNLFHGSPDPNLAYLEPRKTNDEKTSWNSDIAIFATHSIWPPLAFGIFGGSKHPWRIDWEGKVFNAYVPRVLYEERKDRKGYIYVFPNTGFEPESGNGWQWKSKQNVKPIRKIEVTLQDYLSSGGKLHVDE